MNYLKKQQLFVKDISNEIERCKEHRDFWLLRGEKYEFTPEISQELNSYNRHIKFLKKEHRAIEGRIYNHYKKLKQERRYRRYLFTRYGKYDDDIKYAKLEGLDKKSRFMNDIQAKVELKSQSSPQEKADFIIQKKVYSVYNVNTIKGFVREIWNTLIKNEISPKTSIVLRANVNRNKPKYATFANISKYESYTDFERLFVKEGACCNFKFPTDSNHHSSDALYLMDDLTLDFTWFAIYSRISRKVGYRSKRKEVIELGGYQLLNYKSTNDNCLLMIFRKNTNNKESFDVIRKNTGCNLKGPIDTADKKLMQRLCDYFKLSIKSVNTDLNIKVNSRLPRATITIFIHENHVYQAISRIADGKIDLDKLKVKFNKKLFVFYDLETVYDYVNDEYLAFSLSYCVNGKVKFYLGFDCLDKFYVDLTRLGDSKTQVYILGFNNSGFDDYKLLDYLLINDIKPYTFCFKNRIFIQWDRYKTRDVFKYIPPQSLSDFCKNFKLKNQKIVNHKFKFEEINLYYNNHTKRDFILWVDYVYGEQLEKYNNFDVLSLSEGFFKIRTLLLEFNEELEQYITLGQIAKSMFLKTRGKNFTTTFKNIKEYKDIRSSMLAGMSYSNKKHEKFESLEKRKFLIDVVSLYPYVMMHKDNFYPYGDYELLHGDAAIDAFKRNGFGIYKCNNINQKSLKGINIIPVIDKKTKIYNFNCKNIIETRMLNNVDMKQLLKYGCTFEIEYGYCFKKAASGKQIFGNYLGKFAKIKRNEDENKGTDKYNHGKRELAKMFLNIISGKVMQIFAYEDVYGVFYARSLTKQRKFDDKYENVVGLAHSNDKYIIMKGKKNLDKMYKNKQIKKNTMLLGLYLYSYARKHMYDYSIYNCDPSIIETDSSCITKYKHILRLSRTEIKDINGKNMSALYNPNIQKHKYFGQFEIEVDNITEIISPGKKSYYMEYLKNDDIYTKRRFKGISRVWLEVPGHILNKKDIINKKTWMELCEKYYMKYYYLNKENMNKNKEFDFGKDEYSCLKKDNYLKIMDGETIMILQRIITRAFHRKFKNKNSKTLSLQLEYRIKQIKL